MNIKKINRTNNELTPLMKQYWEIKSKYLNFILFFRLGDFYEMFANDAMIVAPILNIVLTQRCGIPMCGIPYLSINSYLKKIIETGLKVAICDQKQTHRQLKKTVLVERAVTKIITPGMILEDILLDSKTNNYLMAILSDQKSSEISCAIADISTGIFLTYQTNVRFIKNDIFKYNPKEILVPECPDNNNVFEAINIKQNFLVSKIKKSFFDLDNSKKIISELFGLNSLKKFELNNNRIICICGALLLYIKEMQPKSVLIFSKIKYISNEDFMYLDSNTIRNLEIVNSNLNADKIDHSLLSILDKTQTALGARTLRQWILKPLLNISRIKKRQTIVYFFIQNQILCDNIVKQLRKIYDVERIVARIISETVTPRDLTILKQSLKAICEINEILQSNPNKDFVLQTANLKEIISKINLYIQDENLKISFNDGTMIKSGIHDGLDKLKDNLEITKSAILSLESKEQSHTGFKNHLKIRFTSILGYFFEISKSKLNNNRLPKHYILKQTTTNTERYITLELKNLEEKILYTHDQIVRLEHTLFHSLLKAISHFNQEILHISQQIAEIDILCCFAINAIQYNYTCPTLTNNTELIIKSGRHPVVERMLRNGDFISNDTTFNINLRIMLLTGPNMSGKSTYLRQVALLTIMAQIGSFVPAAEAIVGITDRIFTRIGANDNLATGESTFMLEMTETAVILNQYTERSLVILDEVGRGTSIYDGIAIALAIIEFLSANKTIKVLFATHYLELNKLSKNILGVKNYSFSVQKDSDNNIKFLYKLQEGIAKHSYGIYVAKLAGIPIQVIERAYKILNHLKNK